ncbi:tapasin-related protein-like [Acipenser ruthenus]|uniref:tapasin-related protein-like n=1 Tax=Acipenser ruthenus TaxID=7906 RepID=UPI0027421828|nr:tapasin-related protein-like [Acipenser ruthenus]
MFCNVAVICFWLLNAGSFSACFTLKQSGRMMCSFVEEQYYLGESMGPEIQYLQRNALLLLNSPDTEEERAARAREFQHSGVITFLVKDPSLHVARHADEDTDKLQCEMKRYSTAGIHVPWPGAGGVGSDTPDNWFTCTIKHRENQFSVTAFLRQPPSPESELRIGDTDTLRVSAVFVVHSGPTVVETALRRDVRLDCGFSVDHARPDVTVEWRLQLRGDRRKLFSYASRSGQAERLEGEVSVAEIPRGNASLRLAGVTLKSEGTYVCSVYVPPLYSSQDIQLDIVESPRVSVSPSSSLTLREGAEEKLVCDIDGYYPLDVQVEWLREVPGERRLPHVVKHILFTSHRHNMDGTYGISAFFLLRASLQDHGVDYTCRVSHKSLRVSIRKSVRLAVEAAPQIGTILLGFLFFVLLIMLAVLLKYLHKARETSNKKKPY